MTPTSLLEESNRSYVDDDIRIKDEDGGFSNRNAVSTDLEKSLLNQRDRSMALNSEGLEVSWFVSFYEPFVHFLLFFFKSDWCLTVTICHRFFYTFFFLNYDFSIIFVIQFNSILFYPLVLPKWFTFTNCMPRVTKIGRQIERVKRLNYISTHSVSNHNTRCIM